MGKPGSNEAFCSRSSALNGSNTGSIQAGTCTQLEARKLIHSDAIWNHLLKLMISPGMRLGSGSGSRALSSSSLELDTLRLYSERVVSSAFPSLSFCTCKGQLKVLLVNNNS